MRAQAVCCFQHLPDLEPLKGIDYASVLKIHFIDKIPYFR